MKIGPQQEMCRIAIARDGERRVFTLTAPPFPSKGDTVRFDGQVWRVMQSTKTTGHVLTADEKGPK
jgi:hypothetical protein